MYTFITVAIFKPPTFVQELYENRKRYEWMEQITQ